ncbi:hypothetical protein JOE25_000563 [Serratia sp. PL17]|nr:hypothetical protein [Serratia sp. PL17]
MGCATRLRISILLSYSHSLRSQDNGMRCFRLKRYYAHRCILRRLSSSNPVSLSPCRALPYSIGNP